ncbi:hypothetical protein LCGC14_2535650 [marine sediment metagenome]|uniref:Uncharacterized protein n=1 Tax=marine sediment metagenome TaxID=412755 RepID=A0A0F9ASM5_9ZZZZ
MEIRLILREYFVFLDACKIQHTIEVENRLNELEHKLRKLSE